MCQIIEAHKPFSQSYAFSSIQEKFFLLELKNGFLRLMYDFGFINGPMTFESNSTKLQINDARYHEVRHTPNLGEFSSDMFD